MKHIYFIAYNVKVAGGFAIGNCILRDLPNPINCTDELRRVEERIRKDSSSDNSPVIINFALLGISE